MSLERTTTTLPEWPKHDAILTQWHRTGGRPAPVQPPPALVDPAWFGAVMGSAATATVASLHPGRLTGFADASATILVAASIVAFVALFVRDFLIRSLGRNLAERLRSPRKGPAYATIPGAINVLAVGALRVWPGMTDSPAGWWLLFVMAGIGTVPGLALTVVFFVSAFEHEQFQAEHISGIWFIPETVVLLGAFLFAELAHTGSVAAQRGLAVLAVALLGAGGLLFGITAVIFVNRLVLHAGGPPHWRTRYVDQDQPVGRHLIGDAVRRRQ